MVLETLQLWFPYLLLGAASISLLLVKREKKEEKELDNHLDLLRDHSWETYVAIMNGDERGAMKSYSKFLREHLEANLGGLNRGRILKLMFKVAVGRILADAYMARAAFRVLNGVAWEITRSLEMERIE